MLLLAWSAVEWLAAFQYDFAGIASSVACALLVAAAVAFVVGVVGPKMNFVQPVDCSSMESGPFACPVPVGLVVAVVVAVAVAAEFAD